MYKNYKRFYGSTRRALEETHNFYAACKKTLIRCEAHTVLMSFTIEYDIGHIWTLPDRSDTQIRADSYA